MGHTEGDTLMIVHSMGWFQRGFWIFFLFNAEFSPCWALPEYIRGLIHLACLRVFSVTP